MTATFDAHIRGKDVVSMGELAGTGTVVLTVEDEDANGVCLYFADTQSARVFLAKALNELRRLERGDLPYNTTHDRVEVGA